jgi:ABC transport system ATP-binding/permease protein
VQEYLGGYADWVRQRPPLAAAAPEARTVPPRARTGPRRLSYREQRELAELPARIEALEAEQRALGATIADPNFYRQPAATITAALDRTQAIEHELGDLYARWDALDSRAP